MLELITGGSHLEYRSELKQFGLTYFHLFTFSTRVYILGTLHTSTQVLNLGPFSFLLGYTSWVLFIIICLFIHFTLLYFALILVYFPWLWFLPSTLGPSSDLWLPCWFNLPIWISSIACLKSWRLTVVRVMSPENRYPCYISKATVPLLAEIEYFKLLGCYFWSLTLDLLI